MSQEPEDLIPTDGQIKSKAFHYKVKVDDSLEPIFITVLATNATTARNGLNQYPSFAGKSINYYGCSEHIIQVNG